MALKFSTVANLVTRVTALGLTVTLGMVYLPKVFSLNSEFVFVAMPLAIIFLFMALYAQVDSLYNCIIRLKEKNSNE